MNPRRLPPTLLALSPGHLQGQEECAGFARAARATFDAGLRGLLLREPGLSDRQACALVDSLVALGREHAGAWIGVHDRVHVALSCGADGVHLGFRSLTPARAAQIAGAQLSIGYSAHAGERPEDCAGADYLLLGPLFETPSKRGRLAPLDVEGFARELARLPAPAWAIGGVRPEETARALAAGASGIAVLSGIFGSARPDERARDYLAALGP